MDKIVNIIAKLSQNLGEMEELAREQLNIKELTTAQMHYLEVINEMSNPNITELATEMRLTKPSVTVALDKLIKKGYVTKIQSDEDRRSSHLHLTKKGMQINQMHEHAHAQFAELMLEAFEPKELEVLTVLLEKLTKSL
ncbi:MAG: MarR family transcriptional regulator [Bacteroidales bacterium]|nr:MarR family transcriptional regulator [Bacteroidales bacterium]